MPPASPTAAMIPMRLSVLTSAVVAALVGFGGTIAIVVAASQAAGADPAQISSGVVGLCLSMAATSAFRIGNGRPCAGNLESSMAPHLLLLLCNQLDL